uniref:CP2 domain-containing protein n=1 Tax=Caenorhabditis tropicalis TaxID=1561998 RepID=A0A1I7US12_9PELO
MDEVHKAILDFNECTDKYEDIVYEIRQLPRPANFNPTPPIQIYRKEINFEELLKTPKIHYMERALDDGQVVRIAVVDDNAARTLMGNSFKKCYAQPGEVESIETTPEATRHVICCPSPIAPVIENMTLYSLPGAAELQHYQVEKACRQTRKCPTADEYRAALEATKSSNPLLRKEKKPNITFWPRSRPSEELTLEKMLEDSKRNSRKILRGKSAWK